MKIIVRVLLLLSLAALPDCGRLIHGGIVDNGNKPQNPVPTEGAPGDLPRISPTILGQYTVDAPFGWQINDDTGKTTLKTATQQIEFAKADAMCGAVSEQNQFGVGMAWCSATETDLSVAGTFVRAVHTPRDELITRILRSFRQKSGG